MSRVTGYEEHRIALEAAAELTRRFRRGEHQQTVGWVAGHYVGRGILEEILAQPGCVGLRIYHGEKADGQPALVISGVDGEGDDLYQGVLAEETYPCPPFCSTTNPLTS